MPTARYLKMIDMGSASDEGGILVTGACGHIGCELCRILRNVGRRILPVDVDQGKTSDVLRCDLRSKTDISRVFELHAIRVVIHLVGILPSAFQVDPLTGADVNLGGSCELMRQSAAAHVKRFIFASSMSVYGSSPTRRPVNEDDPPAPDEPYGASKLTVELIGQTLRERRLLSLLGAQGHSRQARTGNRSRWADVRRQPLRARIWISAQGTTRPSFELC